MTIFIILLCAIPAILVALFNYYVFVAALERSGVPADRVLAGTQITIFASMAFGGLIALITLLTSTTPREDVGIAFVAAQVFLIFLALVHNVVSLGIFRGIAFVVVCWIYMLCLYSPFVIIISLMNSAPSGSIY